MITKEYLRSLFDYDGCNLIWAVDRGVIKRGRVAGTVNSRGYRHIRIDDKFYQSHRLIWIYFNSCLTPEMVVDHINRNRLDNRIENLRLVDRSANSRNSVRSDHYNVGIWQVNSGKFQANYNTNGKRHYIGLFKTEAEAISARNEFIKRL